MNIYQKRIQLLSLFSIYFVYKAIAGFLEGDTNAAILWTMICIVYLISIIIFQFVAKRYKTAQEERMIKS